MAEDSFKVVDHGGHIEVFFSGPIDENFSFAPLAGGKPVVLNLQEVSHINSIGIKNWIQWIVPVAESAEIILDNCPKSIVLQMNMVRNFLPQGARVRTFQVPIYCEECDKECSSMFSVGTDIVVDGAEVEIKKSLPEAMSCSKSSEDCEAELDVIEKKYFRFLTS